ncbi:MAG TPA: zinc-dependent metalloprotease, partial [Mycobacteriales bacterium]|nr:zinc-dependent metalloprotease [Mycobacteriales bacterium]
MRPPLVDWDLAAATATRLARPGPVVDRAVAVETVRQLRSLAVEAESHVRSVTGMSDEESPAPATVLDRPGWIEANVAGFRTLVDPLTEELFAERTPPAQALGAVGSRITGVQVGGLLAYLSGRVLGQYEVFLPEGQGAGRLTLVAPNIVATETRLGVDPRDFRLWVCLHEVTHRVQFRAVPWLREHIRGEITAFVRASDLDPAALFGRLRAASGQLAAAVTGRGELSLIEAVQTPEQRVVLDRLTGLMSLVEGHAEYVMDVIGPDVIPSVGQLRARFEARRREGNPFERALRRLLGIELKMRQYAEGARFVRAAVDQVGMTGFNRVWTSSATLPDAGEIRDPDRWLARMADVPPAAVG